MSRQSGGGVAEVRVGSRMQICHSCETTVAQSEEFVDASRRMYPADQSFLGMDPGCDMSSRRAPSITLYAADTPTLAAFSSTSQLSLFDYGELEAAAAASLWRWRRNLRRTVGRSCAEGL